MTPQALDEMKSDLLTLWSRNAATAMARINETMTSGWAFVVNPDQARALEMSMTYKNVTIAEIALERADDSEEAELSVNVETRTPALAEQIETFLANGVRRALILDNQVHAQNAAERSRRFDELGISDLPEANEKDVVLAIYSINNELWNTGHGVDFAPLSENADIYFKMRPSHETEDGTLKIEFYADAQKDILDATHMGTAVFSMSSLTMSYDADVLDKDEMLRLSAAAAETVRPTRVADFNIDNHIREGLETGLGL